MNKKVIINFRHKDIFLFLHGVSINEMNVVLSQFFGVKNLAFDSISSDDKRKTIVMTCASKDVRITNVSSLKSLLELNGLTMELSVSRIAKDLRNSKDVIKYDADTGKALIENTGN